MFGIMNPRLTLYTYCGFFAVDHCNPNPCGLNDNNPLNDGVCYEDSVQNTFVCDCPAGWVNFNCEQRENNISSLVV